MSEHVVLISGVRTGIGRANAPAFGRDGSSVVVSGRHGVEGDALTAALALGRQGRFTLRPT
jgi:NAD(P)-dependent dehydrogenase (short-subunit alcohol dehydrogenase family)